VLSVRLRVQIPGLPPKSLLIENDPPPLINHVVVLKVEVKLAHKWKLKLQMEKSSPPLLTKTLITETNFN
jgi:hypothetical protein